MGYYSNKIIEQMNEAKEQEDWERFENDCDKLYADLKGEYGTWLDGVLQGLKTRFDNDNDNDFKKS